jgi:hypothetical protein
VIVDGGDVIFFCEVESQIEIPRAASKRCAANKVGKSEAAVHISSSFYIRRTRVQMLPQVLSSDRCFYQSGLTDSSFCIPALSLPSTVEWR